MATQNIKHEEEEINDISEEKSSSSALIPLPYSHRSNNLFLPMNKPFALRLLRLKFNAAQYQYSLACLNTLGGAYHLCNKPDTALMIARRQESLARNLGSSTLLLRAKGFQATSVALLGKPKEAIIYLNKLLNKANKRGLTEIANFIEATIIWLKHHQKSPSDNAPRLTG